MTSFQEIPKILVFSDFEILINNSQQIKINYNTFFIRQQTPTANFLCIKLIIQDFDRECQHHYATCEIHILRFVQSLINNIQHGAVNSPLSPAVMKEAINSSPQKPIFPSLIAYFFLHFFILTIAVDLKQPSLVPPGTLQFSMY